VKAGVLSIGRGFALILFAVSQSVYPLLGGNHLKSICLTSPVADLWTMYLLLREQKCRFITPLQGAGLLVLSMGDKILTDSPICPLGSQTQQWCLVALTIRQWYWLVNMGALLFQKVPSQNSEIVSFRTFLCHMPSNFLMLSLYDFLVS
jgi:hypothetical protein